MNEPDCKKEPAGTVVEPPPQASDVPLFLKDRPEGQKGDSQDEKDETAE